MQPRSSPPIIDPGELGACRVPAWILYAIGVFILGLAYETLKQSLNGPALIALVLTYLLVLSGVAGRFGKK